MIEVFKTNVKDSKQAEALVKKIHRQFPASKANFDLEDCDNILRVECAGLTLDATAIIEVVKQGGYHAEVLPGEAENSKIHGKPREY